MRYPTHSFFVLASLVVLSAVSFVSGVGCGIAPLSVIGEQCERNSDCDDPLVCGLGRCRRECETTRDCALSLQCIELDDPEDPRVLGVCQLPEENTCTLDSDCEAPLVCFPPPSPGGCLLRCVDTGDCSPGATCVAGECVEPEVAHCTHTSDCKYPMVCDPGSAACVQECTTSFDCGAAGVLACVQHMSCDAMSGRPEGPCMCRQACTMGDTSCPLGTECVPCGAGLDCAGVDAYCERPNPDGVMSGG